MKKFSVQLNSVTKIFDEDFVAVDDVSLNIEQGEFFSLLGPSGCGKTTILRMIGGFEDPTSGSISLNGKDILGIPPNKREVNTIFQNYALFPNMTVYENIAFSLRLKKISEKEIKTKVMEMVNLTRLNGHENKKTNQLSGGQKQRVAIARALINKPTVLLLDEPLAALDAKLRQHMLVELDNIHEEVGITFLYVTHDQSEAMSISDHLAVMNEGNVIQMGTPVEVYESPVNPFVANFIGETNFFSGVVEEIKIRDDKDKYIILQTDRFGEITCFMDREVKTGTQIQVSLRPEKIKISKSKPKIPENAMINCLNGKVEEVIYLGNQTKFTVDINGKYMKTFKQHIRYLLDEKMIEWKDDVYIWWFADDSYLLDETGGIKR